MYEDPTEKIVEFTPLHTWQIGEENVIEYTLPVGFDEAACDWIGVYKVTIHNNNHLRKHPFYLSVIYKF